MKNLFVSIIIPTYKRANLIHYNFNALKKQIYKNFETIVILKPSNDGTEKIINEYKNILNIRLIIQKEGYIVDAINRGIKSAKGDILVFLDDDAIPFPDLLEKIVTTYSNSSVVGIAGDVKPAIIRNNKIFSFMNKKSEIIPNYNIFMYNYEKKIFNRPIERQENYLIYISKAGKVNYNISIANIATKNSVCSLLGMGANMSVLSEVVKDIKLPAKWILGISYEQYLAWYIWRKGYKMIFNPNIKVWHILHGETLSRNIKNKKKDVLRYIEYELLFYRLYNVEPSLNILYKLVSNIYDVFISIKLGNISNVLGIIISNIIGIKWLLSKKYMGKYNPFYDLKKFL